MTCTEVREYLFPFLDSELDAPLSIEIQRHLDSCPRCAREAEIERTIGKRLGAVIETTGDDVPVFDQSTAELFGQRGQPEPTPGRRRRLLPFRWHRWLATAAALAIVVGAGTWLVIGGGDPRPGPSRFAELVVSDFEHFLDGGSRVELASADSRAVADWLRDKTTLAVVLPVPAAPVSRLVGCRKCKIDDRPAAFAIYDVNGIPVSLVAFAVERGDFDGMNEVRRGGLTYWVDHCRGHAVVAYRRGQLVYAAVSTLPEQDLLSWMMTEEHESD
ncbi:MAG: zf-HC2 domain-containing protein [Phycisphaerales bacterium]|nr:MAG: zf-HC2 domain-containing protein [Phycisphaerales bacterium]